MKASIVAILFACLLSLCVSTPKDAENTPWDGMNCEELKAMKPSDDLSQEKINDMVAACEENKKFVYNLRKQGDLSVVYSTYLRVKRDYFDSTFTMHELKFGGVTPDLAGIPEVADKTLNIWDKVSEDKQKKMIAALNIPLAKHNEIYAKKMNYVVYAAIDLMNLVYTKEFPTDENGNDITWKFSTEQVLHDLAPGEEYNKAKLVFEHLSEEGVCTEDGYAKLPTSCRRYFIGHYYRLLDMTNQGLVDKLESGHPVYAQVALHPEIFQFHSPAAEHPIGKGETRPNLAGVVTGFNFTNKGKEYWEIYIRRHELHADIKTKYDSFNYVRIAAKFEDKDGNLLNPYAGITSMSYTIDVDEEDRDRGKNADPILELKMSDHGATHFENVDGFNDFIRTLIGDMYQTTDEAVINKKAEDITVLHLNSELFNFRELVDNGQTLSLSESILKGLTTIILDLGDEGWSDEYLFVFDDIFNYDIIFPDMEEPSSTRRLGDINLADHYYDGLTATQKSKSIKVNGALKTISFGKNTMPNMGLFVYDCPNLETIQVKENAFKFGWIIRIENNTKLKQISFGPNTFAGWPDNKELPKKVPMFLRDLTKLNTFVFDYKAATNIGEVTCYDVGNKGINTEFTLVEDNAFPNQNSYKYNDNNNVVVNEYFLKVYEEATATPGPCPDSTCPPEPDE